MRQVFAAGSFLVLWCGLAGCVSPRSEPVARQMQPVVNGEPNYDHRGTVQIIAARGSYSSCSGSVVGSRVIMTANHCVDGTRPEDWIVLLGQDPTRTGVVVDEIVTPGPFLEDSLDDIALLLLGSDSGAPIYTAAYDLPESFVTSTVTLVGYGLDENGQSGARLSAQMMVAVVQDLWIRLSGAQYPDSGDSGGPTIDHRGHVVGVTSRGGIRTGMVTRVDAHRWLLDPYLREFGGCVPGDPERCDRVDNNCDGVVDEGCLTEGEGCESSDQCVTGLCEQVRGERICTARCTFSASWDCWDGSYCEEVICGEGLCRPGVAGEGGFGALCSDDTDCASLLCRNTGTGTRRCTSLCEPNALECGPGQVCAMADQRCPACLPAEEVTAPRGLGEPCDSASQCLSGNCLDDPPHRYCSQPCANHQGCPVGMHCRGDSCILGTPGEAGDPCLVDQDCDDERCWTAGSGASICLAPCGMVRTFCPDGWTCDYDEGACFPSGTLVGNSCDPQEDSCVSSGCITVDGQSRCVQPCDPYCPAGYECIDSASDGQVCWPTSASRHHGGGCSQVAGVGSPAALVAGAMGLLF